MKGFCHSGAHPHPPPSGAPSPLQGEGLRAARCAAPTARLEAVVPFRRGRTLAGPHTRRAEVVAPYTKKRSIIAPSSAPVCALGHLPPQGEGLQAADSRPYSESAPVPLVRETQAQMRNRTSGNFCNPRAQWPGWNSDTHSDFRAPEILLNLTGTRPP